MDSIKLYNELLDNQSLDIIPDILSLQETLLREKNYRYYYLCNNKIIELFINKGKLDAALETALEMYNKDDITRYEDSYVQLLDQLVYIYITKQYFLRALDICLKKQQFVDVYNTEEVNRWYLEMAYIHDALGEKNEALRKFTSILSNDPTPETKSLTLSNITKLLIDEDDTDSAKDYLDQCILLVNEINDVQGIRYCDYLKSRILRIEKKYKEAKKIFSNMFKDFPKLEDDGNVDAYFNYLNEYLNLLIDSNAIKEGIELCEKYYNEVEVSFNLQNKLLFYKSCLRLEVILINQTHKKKKDCFDVNLLLMKINDLEKEIGVNKDRKRLEASEEELSFQAKNLEKQIYKKTLNTLKDINFDYTCGNIRAFLISFGESLKNKIPFEEMQIIILNKEKDNIIPEFKINQNNDVVFSYQYKNNRLYERELSFENLIDTPIESLLVDGNDIVYNLSYIQNPVLSPINKNDLRDEYKFLYLSSITKGKNIIGAVIFLSKAFDIINDYSKFVLNITSKQLSFAITSLYNLNNNVLQYNVLKTCNANTNSGIFYYDGKHKNYYLSEEVLKLINDYDGFDDNISDELFMKNIIRNDYSKFITKNEKIFKKEPYEIEYHIIDPNNSQNFILVHEQASPYISLNNEVIYCGTITKIRLSETLIDDINTNRILGEKDFDSFIYSHIKDQMTIYAFKFTEDKGQDDLLIFNLIKDCFAQTKQNDLNFNNKIYYVSGIYYYISFSTSDKEAYKLVKNIVKYCSATYFIYPTNLKRIQEINDLANFILKKTSGYQPFNTDVYASFISIDALNECFNKSLINNDVSLKLNKVTISNHFFGYFMTPFVKGIYNHDSLMTLNEDSLYKLYKYVLINYNMIISNTNNSNNILIMKISNKALFKLLENKLITDHQIIFDLSDSYKIDEILSKISTTNCKVIINNEILSNLSFGVLNKYSKLIVGFNEKIDDNLVNIFKMFQPNYYFYNKKGFVIDEESITISLKN